VLHCQFQFTIGRRLHAGKVLRNHPDPGDQMVYRISSFANFNEYGQ
jgi:hypothetical protein